MWCELENDLGSGEWERITDMRRDRKTREHPRCLADSPFLGDKFHSVGLPLLWIPVEEIKY